MLAVTLRPSFLITLLAILLRTSAAPTPNSPQPNLAPNPSSNSPGANFRPLENFDLETFRSLETTTPAQHTLSTSHGLRGDHILIIACVGILGGVILILAGIWACYLCARMEYDERRRRGRAMWEEEGDGEERDLIFDHHPDHYNYHLDHPDHHPEHPSHLSLEHMPRPPSVSSHLSGDTAYVSLPSDEPASFRGTPLEVLRVKNMLFNHDK